jgi:hypothetical protein
MARDQGLVSASASPSFRVHAAGYAVPGQVTGVTIRDVETG